MKIMLKRLTITGSTLRIREKTYKAKILNDLKKIVFPNFENGKIKCYIDSVFKLKDVNLPLLLASPLTNKKSSPPILLYS